jgi:RNA methyltransferase, TrmH family
MKPIIHSLQNSQVKLVRQLRDARHRRRQSQFLIDGLLENRRAAAGGIDFDCVYYRHASSNASLIEDQFQDELLQPVTDKVMEKLSYGDRCEEVIGVARTPALELDRLRPPSPALILVLDSCEKPGNLGACARSAVAAGANGLILSDPLCDLFNPNAIRASRGCLFSLPVATDTSEQVIQWCFQHKIRLLAGRVDGSESLWKLDLRQAVAIVFGNEAEGLGDSWKGVDSFQIPMQNTADSLNVSTSAAVTLYEALRQRSC